MRNKHFEFVEGDTITTGPGRTLKRIRALAAIATLGIVPGDVGGYVESDANLSGDAWVSGDARVYGDALVSGNARVSGDARVSGNDSILVVGPAKSSGRYTTAHKDEKLGVLVNCGCFSGSVLEFSKAIEDSHKNNKAHLEQYRLFCQLISFNFDVEAK